MAMLTVQSEQAFATLWLQDAQQHPQLMHLGSFDEAVDPRKHRHFFTEVELLGERPLRHRWA